jgi:hypothetical protein
MKDKQLLLEISYDKLLQNTRRSFDDGRDQRSSEVRITNTLFMPYIGDDRLEAEGESQTTNGKYTSRVMFDNVIFKDEESPETSSVVAVDGEQYFFIKINRSRSNVKVSCSCLDFHYRFATYNHRDDALAAKAPKVHVKSTGRPPVNPAEVSGVCKHIIRLVEELDRDDLFT